MAISGPGRWYGQALVSALSGEIDVTTDTLKMLLTDGTFSPDQDTMRYADAVTGETSRKIHVIDGL